MKLSRKTVPLCALVLTLLFAATEFNPISAESRDQLEKTDQLTIAVRRLTESQYRHTIRDVFSPEVEINARFEPEQREGGLLAIGSAMLSLTSSGFEQYFALASSISDQVLGDELRESVMPCIPVAAIDHDCVRQFVSRFGELLFRRPLSAAELDARVATAETGASQAQDFYAGLKLALTSLLVAPEFLFRVETAELSTASAHEYRLNAYSMATRLSFLFWDTTPDKILLDAAASGALYAESGLQSQIARLSESPQMAEGIEAFFVDMMQIDGFENMVKDPAIYPKFNQLVSDSAREQMLLTINDLLITNGGDYRDIFTSNKTFINRALAAVYRVPYTSQEEWAAYEFPEDSERAGLITQIGPMSLWAHPGTSSPTRRGIKIHEIFMCEPTPDPPADVDFSLVQDSTKGTTRGRLLDHMENAGCSSCHGRSDPAGLALEHFDGLGQFRTLENGVFIDVSATLYDGSKFTGAQGLGEFLHDDPRIPSCLVRNVFSYGVAQLPRYEDRDYLQEQTELFANNGYRISTLFEEIASTAEFYHVRIPEGIKANSEVIATTP
ncbi:MAG: hypothetical protein COA96_13950 [SAR86 cluster bacterium]|uniref:DUF1592 domain-containing protein n=1 Tax=SAR86 cluster bacterium TaxID=2030880 RepID=A0A2A5ATG4_9GAMM|nr:MAG: hypothetical protein COA96_13950 [SAR86 cluster bacterium]